MVWTQTWRAIRVPSSWSFVCQRRIPRPPQKSYFQVLLLKRHQFSQANLLAATKILRSIKGKKELFFLPKLFCPSLHHRYCCLLLLFTSVLIEPLVYPFPSRSKLRSSEFCRLLPTTFYTTWRRFHCFGTPGSAAEPPIIRLTEYGELSVGPDGFRQSPRSHLALILSVVVQRRVLDANVVFALFFAAHDRVARKGRDCPFKSCNKKQKKRLSILNETEWINYEGISKRNKYTDKYHTQVASANIDLWWSAEWMWSRAPNSETPSENPLFTESSSLPYRIPLNSDCGRAEIQKPSHQLP